MRYDREHKQRTRARVIDEAAKAVRANGPQGVGVAEIMGKAGLTHGGFYAHFKSKEELIAEAVGAMFEQARRRFRQEVGDRSPAAALAAYIDFYLSPSHRDARATGCPVTALATDLARVNGPAREVYSRGVDSLSRSLSGLLEALGRENAEALGRSTLSELIGALSLARAVSDPGLSDRLLESSREALKRRLGVEGLS